MGLLIKFLSSEDGATALEYALIAALISLGGIAALAGIGGNSESLWGDIGDDVSSAMSKAHE